MAWDVRESLKLSRNSKGFTWEIKIVPENGKNLTDDDFKRLQKRNEELMEKYGNEV